MYDALLIVSFGGPEGPADVLPFLENVAGGRNIPRQRLLEVAEHYQRFGGVSPLNAQTRELAAALSAELAAKGPPLPVYWGNRNWHPFLAETVARMAADGVQRAAALVNSAYSSYSSCRQYLENIADARAAVGPSAPRIDKLRAFFNHPGFIAATSERLRAAWELLPADQRAGGEVLFTAHSLPLAMAERCDYARQLAETARLVAEAVGPPRWRLVYQSRSGPPTQPWLGPDVVEALTEAPSRGATAVCLAPIGFLSDHLEVIYDLDVEAAEAAERLGLPCVRAATVGTSPRYVSMIRELILERLDPQAPRKAVGVFPPLPDECAVGCCAIAASSQQ